MKKIHLICNAHIDPVWLWTWEEGLAITLSTFRIAARFCSKYGNFVFCHNEALLYQWVEEYEPDLFRLIRKLVKAGKWQIIGGWYLQPDCNLPSGESLVRQIIVGKNYFREKFSVEPDTAVNFDSFGHSRGLVQILEKSGYDSYLFCRPGETHLSVPDDFVWNGFDGSEILAHRSLEHYNSEMGNAAGKLQQWIQDHPDTENGIFLWGIGNHGGGPSEEDIQKIDDLLLTIDDLSIKHSFPEEYFSWLATKKETLPRFDQDLNPWAVGCYTSMARVKHMHRELEEAFFLTEKMVTHAALTGLMKYPGPKLNEALKDLLFCEFHDILPGSGVPEVESLAIRRMGHGLEILSRLRARAFFKLLSGQEPAKKDEFPILVYNPEPFDLDENLTIELQGSEPNFNPDVFLLPELFDENGHPVEYQLEKELANIANDHRKRLVFKAYLKAFSMNRFSCYLREAGLLEKPMSPVQGELHFINESCEIRINADTGLIDQYKVDGFDYFKPDTAELLVMQDYADPWGMKVDSFRNQVGRFSLMSPSEAAAFAGTNGPVLPVRIIETGPVRTVVEGLFRYNHSAAQVKYSIPKKSAILEIEIRMLWMEKDKMLKLAFPTRLENPEYLGQTAFGIQKYDRPGEELVAHQWVGLFQTIEDKAITISNKTTYGFDHSDGELRLSLLRSPAYAGHPVDDNTPIVRQDRFTPRMDQGEHLFRFRINAGSARERINSVDLESRRLNAEPVILCCFPTGKGKKPYTVVKLSDHSIRLSAMKFSETGNRLILRLFETTGKPVRTEFEMPLFGLDTILIFKPHEIKTLSIDPKTTTVEEVNLLEQKVDSWIKNSKF